VKRKKNRKWYAEITMENDIIRSDTMSYDVDLVDNEGNIVEVVPHQEGGIVCLGGSDKAALSVTYNYTKFYYENLDEKDGLRWLDGKLAKDTLVRLEQTIEKLVGDKSDYYEATAGNAKHALKILLAWAKQYPYAKFKVV
jgi:hypothetical protein